MVPMWHRRNEPLSSWRASVPTRHVGVAEVLFQRAPALVRKAFTRPRVDPLPRPLGCPASPALVPNAALAFSLLIPSAKARTCAARSRQYSGYFKRDAFWLSHPNVKFYDHWHRAAIYVLGSHGCPLYA